MPIPVSCTCGKTYRAKDEHAGKSAQCPSCGRKMRIPAESAPAHDVFISHSSSDKAIADAVCAILESEGLRCWVAPRDIRPGSSWGGSIYDAIRTSRIMVMILSTHANTSDHVMREVELGVKHQLVIVPFRTEDIEPSADLAYFLSSSHWLDAMTPPMEDRIRELSGCLAKILNARTKPDGRSGVSVAPSSAGQPKQTTLRTPPLLPKTNPWSSHQLPRWGWACGLLVLIATATLVAVIAARKPSSEGNVHDVPATKPAESSETLAAADRKGYEEWLDKAMREEMIGNFAAAENAYKSAQAIDDNAQVRSRLENMKKAREERDKALTSRAVSITGPLDLRYKADQAQARSELLRLRQECKYDDERKIIDLWIGIVDRSP